MRRQSCWRKGVSPINFSSAEAASPFPLSLGLCVYLIPSSYFRGLPRELGQCSGPHYPDPGVSPSAFSLPPPAGLSPARIPLGKQGTALVLSTSSVRPSAPKGIVPPCLEMVLLCVIGPQVWRRVKEAPIAHSSPCVWFHRAACSAGLKQQ